MTFDELIKADLDNKRNELRSYFDELITQLQNTRTNGVFLYLRTSEDFCVQFELKTDIFNKNNALEIQHQAQRELNKAYVQYKKRLLNI